MADAFLAELDELEEEESVNVQQPAAVSTSLHEGIGDEMEEEGESEDLDSDADEKVEFAIFVSCS